MPNLPNFSLSTWIAVGIILMTVICAFPVLVLIYGLLLNLVTRRYTVDPAVRRRGRGVLIACLVIVGFAFSSGLWVRQFGPVAIVFYGMLEVMLICAIVLMIRFLRQPLRRPLRLATSALLTGGLLMTLCLPLLLVVADFCQKISQYNNFNEAEVRATLRKNPNDPAAHSSLAQIDALHRDHAGAMSEWQQVLRVNPDNQNALFMLAHELTRAHRPDEALPLYQKMASGNGPYRDSAQKWLARYGRQQ